MLNGESQVQFPPHHVYLNGRVVSELDDLGLDLINKDCKVSFTLSGDANFETVRAEISRA